MTRSGSLLAKGGLALCSTVVCLVALELAWRIFLFGGDAFSYRKMDSLRSFGRAGLVQRAKHPEVIFELKPNLDTWYQLVPFRTNAHGLRDETVAHSKPADTFRVAVVGDSYTMPAGVRLENAYHSRLERRLSELSPELRFEFVNFGVAGYFLRQYAAVIREKALAYDPDLVLIGFCGRNDHHIRPESAYREPYEPHPPEHPFFHPTFLQKLMRVAEFRLFDARNPGAYQSRDRQLRYLREHFGAIAELADRNGIHVVVALLDTRPIALREELEQILDQAGLHFVDASARLAGEDPDDFAIYPTNEHPNGEANRIFAEEIQAFLLGRGLVPVARAPARGGGNAETASRSVPRSAKEEP